MNYEFSFEDDFLIIKLSGATEVNERLSVKEHLAPYLNGTNQKVIVNLQGLHEPEGVYIVGVLNTIKKEFQLQDGRVKLCSLGPGLYRYFRDNRLDQIFDVGQSLESTKRNFREKQ